eukprot:1049618-Pyramimonas_sp.AAC.1
MGHSPARWPQVTSYAPPAARTPAITYPCGASVWPWAAGFLSPLAAHRGGGAPEAPGRATNR